MNGEPMLIMPGPGSFECGVCSEKTRAWVGGIPVSGRRRDGVIGLRPDSVLLTDNIGLLVGVGEVGWASVGSSERGGRGWPMTAGGRSEPMSIASPARGPENDL